MITAADVRAKLAANSAYQREEHLRQLVPDTFSVPYFLTSKPEDNILRLALAVQKGLHLSLPEREDRRDTSSPLLVHMQAGFKPITASSMAAVRQSIESQIAEWNHIPGTLTSIFISFHGEETMDARILVLAELILKRGFKVTSFSFSADGCELSVLEERLPVSDEVADLFLKPDAAQSIRFVADIGYTPPPRVDLAA